MLKINLKNWTLDILNGKVILAFGESGATRLYLALIALVVKQEKKRKSKNLFVQTQFSEIRSEFIKIRDYINPDMKEEDNLYTMWYQHLRLYEKGYRPYTVYTKDTKIEIFYKLNDSRILTEFEKEKDWFAKQMTEDDREKYYTATKMSDVNLRGSEKSHLLNKIISRVYKDEETLLLNLFTIKSRQPKRNPTFCLNIHEKDVVIEGLDRLRQQVKSDATKPKNKIQTKQQPEPFPKKQSKEIPQQFSIKPSNNFMYIAEKKALDKTEYPYAIGTTLVLQAFEKREILIKGSLKILYTNPENKISKTSATQTSDSVLKEFQIIAFNTTDNNKVLKAFPLHIDCNKKFEAVFWFATDRHTAIDLLNPKSRLITESIYCYLSFENHRGEKFDYSLYLKPVSYQQKQ